MNKHKNLDLKHIWHPYTNIDHFENSVFNIFTHGQGVFLFNDQGGQFIDAISSWWCLALGHSYPALINAIKNQADTLQHCILANQSHQSIIELSQELSTVTPEGLNRFYFCADGSSAVEAAMRIALQYYSNIGETKKTKFLSIAGGYHGDTMNAVSVGYLEDFHSNLKDVINKNFIAQASFKPRENNQQEMQRYFEELFNELERIAVNNADQIAAVILEPLCQGASGVRIYDSTLLQRARQICDANNILLILDEIAIGFGRTGDWFACQTAQVKPDIMTIGKALSGGYQPISAAITNDKIYNTFRNDNTFFHGHTFAGNPIAAAVSRAAIQEYKKIDIISKSKAIGQYFQKFKDQVQVIREDIFVQSIGSVLSIHLPSVAEAKKIAKIALETGIILRPLGQTIYVWPPYIIKEEEIEEILKFLKNQLSKSKK